MAANESVIKIRFSWTVPDDPNGIIVGYRVRQIVLDVRTYVQCTYVITYPKATNLCVSAGHIDLYCIKFYRAKCYMYNA